MHNYFGGMAANAFPQLCAESVTLVKNRVTEHEGNVSAHAARLQYVVNAEFHNPRHSWHPEDHPEDHSRPSCLQDRLVALEARTTAIEELVNEKNDSVNVLRRIVSLRTDVNRLLETFS